MLKLSGMNSGLIAKKKGCPAITAGKFSSGRGRAKARQLRWSCLSFVGTLVIAGYGMQKNEYMMSRLMAFDADIRGTWGCLPKYYPVVLKMVLDRKIEIEPFVETRPMSQIQQAFEEVHKGGTEKRIVLTPDF